MSGTDWHDPFADDRDAQERERRRAEREARRRGTQESLGEKVSEETGEHEEVSPPTGEEPEAPAPVPAEPESPAAPAPAPHHPAPTADPGFEWTDSPRRAEPSGAGPGGVPPQLLWFRRALGVLVVLALVAVVGFVFAKVIDAIGGDEEPASGPATLEVGEVVIPEGYTRRQIADESAKGLKGSYMEATKKAPKGFPIDEYAPDGAPPNLEGFLFPATYEVAKGASAEDLVALQLEAFESRIRGVDLSYAESKNLNVYDVLKIASMIEREIAVAKERKLASAVIYNRLAAGDTLGIDATIRYSLQNYDEQLTQSQLDDASNPYNSRVNPGLPPTPIGNPGLASIKAAAKPAKSDAYFFVIKPGTCNEHTFVATNEEFLEAEAEYQAALEAEGGSPTDC